MDHEKSVFIIELTYRVPLKEVDANISGHVEFLEQGYAEGVFLASGPKVPRTGGVIVAQASARDVLQDRLAFDPFHVRGIADYKITEFIARKHVLHFFG